MQITLISEVTIVGLQDSTVPAWCEGGSVKSHLKLELFHFHVKFCDT